MLTVDIVLWICEFVGLWVVQVNTIQMGAQQLMVRTSLSKNSIMSTVGLYSQRIVRKIGV